MLSHFVSRLPRRSLSRKNPDVLAGRKKGKLNIVVLVSSLDQGGTERVVASLCNAWGARGDAVTLVPTYSGGGEPFFEIADRVELTYLAQLVGTQKKSVTGYARRLYALRRLIIARNPDVIVSFLPNVNLAAILSAAFLRIPLIICERTDPLSVPHEKVITPLCRLTYRFADMLTVQTDSVAGKIAGLYPGQNRVRAIPNPLPGDVLSHSRTKSGGRNILLSLGRLSEEKQINRLIDAFADIAPAFSDWDLHIWGDGPHRPMLAQRIEQHGLQARVRLKGVTKSPWETMAGADAFVMTSKYEGFPNALLEAMGVGLPCVAFDCPSGPREISRNGMDALLVPLNDHAGLVMALTRIMSDGRFRHDLGTRARASVSGRFGLAEVMRQWDGLFAEVGAVR